MAVVCVEAEVVVDGRLCGRGASFARCGQNVSQHEVIVNVVEKDEAMVAVEAEGSPLELIGTAKRSATTPRGPEMHQTHQNDEAKANKACIMYLCSMQLERVEYRCTDCSARRALQRVTDL